MEILAKTSFNTIYDSFTDRITSTLFMEMTELDLTRQLQSILLNALPLFEFPRFDLYDYEEGTYEALGIYKGVESGGVEVPATGWVGGTFNTHLTLDEINILSSAMVVEWLGLQLATTENTEMKYSGSDFKFTSQANHMAKIKVLKEQYTKENLHMQRLYKRRKLVDGQIVSTIGQIMEGRIPMILKYDIDIDTAVIDSDLNRLTNLIFKLLPLREEGEDWETPLSNIILELVGFFRLIKEKSLEDQVKLLSIVSKLESLYTLTEEKDFLSFRKIIFECLGRMNQLKDVFR